MLNDKAQVDNMARGIYNAFVQYKNKYDTRMTVPYKTMSDPVAETPQPNSTSEAADNDLQASADNGSKDNADNTANPERNPKPSRTSNTESKPAKTQTVARPTGRIDKTQPVFKVQIIAAQRKLKAGDPNFRGLEECESYEENGMMKYTYGASNNYNEIYRLRKAILDKFPGAFIIAFKNGDKMDVNQAIREFKQNRNK